VGNYPLNHHEVPRDVLRVCGGTSNHIHVLLNAKSTVSVSKIARILKGTSSELINKKRLFPFHFSWQHEYGCVTVDAQNLNRVRNYIITQREHHSHTRTIAHFESTDFRDFGFENAWGNDKSAEEAATQPDID
jgi:hypothetical protein